MSSLAIAIAGVDQTRKCSGLRTRAQTNAVGSGSMQVDDLVGSVIPAIDDAVAVTLAAAPAWSGTVDNPKTTHFGEAVGVSTSVSLLDSMDRARRVLVNRTFAAGTLKVLLTSLCAAPSGELYRAGVTLSASQANGPTLGAVTASWQTALDLLNYLTTLTGYVWYIDASNVLRMWGVGDLSSGVTVSRANGNFISATWERKRAAYRNRQYIDYGPAGTQVDVTQSWTANGADVSWSTTLGQPVVDPPPGYCTLDGVYCTVGPGASFTWSVTNGVGTLAIGTASVPTTGQILSITFRAQYPFTTSQENAGEISSKGPWEMQETKAEILTLAEANTYAAALVASSIARPKLPVVVTTSAVPPGYTVTVDLPEIGLSAVLCLATTVDVEYVDSDAGTIQWYTLTLVDGTSVKQETATDIWRSVIVGSGASSGGGSSSGGGGALVPSPLDPVSIDLGGSRVESLSWAGSAVWGDIPEHQIDVELDGDLLGTRYPHVRAELWAVHAGVGCTARLRNITDGTTAGTSSKITATTPTETIFVVTLAAGKKRYRLQLVSDTANEDVYGMGRFEAG
jgi:hypothetical protein